MRLSSLGTALAQQLFLIWQPAGLTQSLTMF